LKLTALLQLGLLGSTTLCLSGIVTACTAGDDSLAPDGGAGVGAGSVPGVTAGNGSFGGATSTAGAGAAHAGAGNAPSAGSSSVGGVPGAGGSGASGGAPGEPCSNLPPNNGDTCAHAVEYGWCKEPWLGESCRESCGKCSSGASGTGSGGDAGAGSGGSGSDGGFGGGGGQPPVIENGTPGWASRYWDCCKPACGWKANVPGGSTPVSSCSKEDQSLGANYDAKNACEGGGSAYMCHDFGPWAVSDTLAYGFAAVKMGSDYCGKCYQLQFTGSSHTANSDPGSQALQGKTMIVQAINTGGVDGTQFDLLIPGGGVGDFDACSSQWGTSDLGERYGGFYLACQKQNGFNHAASKACAAQKCQSVFAGKPGLLAGCNFFVNWFGAPDNPNLVYKEVACPDAITAQSGLKR
jgi:hypothetical protein